MGPIFPGDTIDYQITLYNQGSVIASDVLVYDHNPLGLLFIDDATINPNWIVENDSLTSYRTTMNLIPGDSLDISIRFIANSGDLGVEDYINIAEIGEIKDVSGFDISDEEIDSDPDSDSDNDGGGVVDSDNDNEVDGDGDGNPGDPDGDGDEDDQDPENVCIIDYFCPDDAMLSSCLEQNDVDTQFESWINEFVGQGCGVNSRLGDVYLAPDECGGSVDVTFLVFDTIGGVEVQINQCMRTFSVEFDNEAPTCPVNWDITVAYDASECAVSPYSTVAQLEASTNGTVSDNCTDDNDIVIESTDEVVPLECSSPGDFFESRQVVRTYEFTDACGNTSDPCPQIITYTFTECNQITDPGTIEIVDGVVLNIPTGCTAPPITDRTPAVSNCDDYVEYMWLVSTAEQSNGQPFIPNDFNMGPQGSGALWEIIPGATGVEYYPGIINENTYFVRCSRSFSCCDYLETNLVGYRIDNDPDAVCPAVNPPTGDDCDEDIILTAIDNMMSAQNEEYHTDRTIQAENRVGVGANLLLNAKDGTTLRPGFEVESNAQLQVQTDGCDNQE